MLENVNELLDEVREACAFLKFATENHTRRVPLSQIEDWKSTDVAAGKRFRKLPIPRKRSELEKEYSTILETGLDELIDLHDARNC